VSTPYSVHCIDEAATASLVHALAHAIRTFFSHYHQVRTPPYLHLSLQGDLGAGKTTAVRYLLKELGYLGKVKSPTYSLCEEHPLTLVSDYSTESSKRQQTIELFHFDFYRMQAPSEWLDSGLDEHFGRPNQPTICIVEWPEKAGDTLPIMDIDITIAHAKELDKDRARIIHLLANTAAGEQLLSNIQV